MILTIDTSQPLSFTDYQLLAAVLTLSGNTAVSPPAPTEAAPEEAPAEEKPKRTRRTKAQIAADEVAAAAEAKPPTEEEPTPDSENAESPGVERLAELASELIVKNKQALVDILAKYGERRVSTAPAEKWPAMIADLEAALA